MFRKTNEIVIAFRDEHGTVVGILMQNGKTEFLRTSPANREHVAKLIEVDDKADHGK